LVESYKKHIADNPKVAMIHFSFDEDEAEATKWAKKESFPWLTVLEPKHKASGLDQFAGEFIPGYILISQEGKVLAKGKDECLEKISAMNKSIASN
jgi:hypothetical protein